MNWQTGLYFSMVLVAIAVTGYLAWQAWRQRGVNGNRFYFWLALAMCLAALEEVFSMLSPTQELALFWFKTRFLPFAVIPPLWLLFTLAYGGRRNWISKRLVAGLSLIPLVTQGMVWSSGSHALWVQQEVSFHQDGLFWIAEVTQRVPGVWFLVHTTYGQLLMLAGSFLLLRAAWRAARLYRLQAGLLSASALVPILTTVITTFNLLPEEAINPTLPGFALAAGLAAAAVFRFEFLKHAPGAPKEPPQPFIAQEKRSLALFLLAFGLLVTGIFVSSYLYYKNFENNYRRQVESQLAMTASLKEEALRNWRMERQADASLFYRNEKFSARAQQFFDNPQDSEARAGLLEWMEKIQAIPEYDRVFLLDSRGVERISLPDTTEPVPEHLKEQAAASLAVDQVIFMDFHRHTVSGPVHLSLLVPIYDPQEDSLPLGVLVMRIDPSVYLYPFIQSWPQPSTSAETLLVRQEGETVLFLNALRFAPRAALNLRLSLENAEVPAVQAIQGYEGILEGIDYIGIPVVAAVGRVPDSPWFLVAKIDTQEVYAPLRERLQQTILFFGALVLAAGAGLGLAWRRQQMRHYRAQVRTLEALRASEERFRLAFDTSPDSVAITRMADGMFVSVNQGFEQITGHSREQVIGKTSLEINIWKDPQDRSKIVEGLREKGVVKNFGAPFLTRTGEIYGLMSAAIIQLNGQPHILNITRDITEQKQAEEQLRRSEADLKQAQAVAHVGSWVWRIQENRLEWSDEMYRIFGIEKEEFSGSLSDVMIRAIHPDDRAAVERSNQSVIEDKKPIPLEYRVVWSNGVIRTVWAEAGELTLNEAGDPLILTGIVQDITERKQSEQALHESEKLLREIAANYPNSYLSIVNKDLTIGFTSGQEFKKQGLEPASFVGLTLEQVFGEHTPLVRENYLKAFGGVETEFELLINNQYQWYRVMPLFNDGNKIDSILVVVENITERKQSEIALQKAEARYRALVEQIPAIIYRDSTEHAGQTLYISPQITTVLGYDPEEWMADIDFWIKIMHPEDRERILADYAQANETGQSFSAEYRLAARDGRDVWIRDEAVLIYDPLGNPAFWQGILLDITARKQAEELLQENEAFIKTVLDNLPVGVAVNSVDPTVTFDYMNDNFIKFYRTTRKKLANPDAFWEAIYEEPGFREEIKKRVLEDCASGNPEQMLWVDVPIARKGEETHFITAKNIPVPGKPLMISTVWDVTERKLAEEVLRRQNEYLNALQETTLELLSELDLDTLLENIVRRAGQLVNTGSGFLDLVDRETDRLAPRIGLGALAESLKRPAKPGEGLAGVVWQTGKPLVVNDYDAWQGRIQSYTSNMLAAVMGVPLLAGNQVLGVLGFGYEYGNKRTFDQNAVEILTHFARLAVISIENARLFSAARQELSERKRAEEQLARYTEKLEEMVDERTRELRAAQEQLIRQERLAMLGQVAGSIGHELRNPLGVISNAIYFLKLTLPDASAKVKEYLDIIENETLASDKIVTGLLDFTRIKSMERKQISIPTLARQVLERYPAPASTRAAIEIPDDLPEAFADPYHITQILGNLVTNAYQAMPEGGELSITANVYGDMIQISVRDTGAGIPPENLQKIFEPLFTTKARGIGLGLAVSQKLAEANNGGIEVQSEPGKGSLFILYLPVYKESI